MQSLLVLDQAFTSLLMRIGNPASDFEPSITKDATLPTDQPRPSHQYHNWPVGAHCREERPAGFLHSDDGFTPIVAQLLADAILRSFL
jgi:hypothetical protein